MNSAVMHANPLDTDVALGPCGVDSLHIARSKAGKRACEEEAESASWVTSASLNPMASKFDGDDENDDEMREDDVLHDIAMDDDDMLNIGELLDDEFSLGPDSTLLNEMEDLLTGRLGSTAHQRDFWALTLPVDGHPSTTLAPLDPTSSSQAEQIPSGPVTVDHPNSYQLPTGENCHQQGLSGEEARVETEIELLVRQLRFLEAQRDFLQYKVDSTSRCSLGLSDHELEEKNRASAEKAQLVKAQIHRQMLAQVTREQLENLKFLELLLLQSPLSHYRMTLMTPMESFIHLTRDPVERRKTLLGLRDSKIDAVYRFIELQSRSIDVERQFFYLDTFEKFGKFYTVDFSISKFDDTTVDEVVNIIYNHFVSTSDAISQILGSVENREYFDGIEWSFLNARFVDRISLPIRHSADRGFVVQESNTVYYVKRLGNSTVLLCDYIDKDDLHPYRRVGRIRKDKTVGMVVEPYVDSQGQQSVLLKRFSFIKHHFKHIPPTPDLVQAISTKVILWGQAVRFCLAGRTKAARQQLQRAMIPDQLAARSKQITAMSR